MDSVYIIVTNQPLGMTGPGYIAISPTLMFIFIIFLSVICGYVGYKSLIWILNAILPCR